MYKITTKQKMIKMNGNKKMTKMIKNKRRKKVNKLRRIKRTKIQIMNNKMKTNNKKTRVMYKIQITKTIIIIMSKDHRFYRFSMKREKKHTLNSTNNSID